MTPGQKKNDFLKAVIAIVTFHYVTSFITSRPTLVAKEEVRGICRITSNLEEVHQIVILPTLMGRNQALIY